jgi:protein TonB
MDYSEQRFSSQRVIGVTFVALLHIVIIYALVTGLGERAVQVLQPPLKVRIIQPLKPPTPPPPPPPPPPQLAQPPPPFIPPPLVQIAQPPPPVPVIASVTKMRPPVNAPVRTPVLTKAAGLDPNQTCAPPQYPEDAADMNETGISVIEFLIDAKGDVVHTGIASSSGYASLDQAAIVGLSQCKFKPAIGSDGKPQEAWTMIQYVWKLN